MKKLLFVVLIVLLFTLSCDHNVYLESRDIWRVGDETSRVYFATANEAIEYIKVQQTKAVSPDRTITLMQPVLAPGSDGIIDKTYYKYIRKENLRGTITVPEDFTGELYIDFNGFRYDYSNSIDYFFVIKGGSEIWIDNGQTVIFEESQSPIINPALIVGTRTVTIDEHLIDDRRKDTPAAVYIEGNGSLVITGDKEERESTYVGGTFTIDEGGTLEIKEGTVYIADIIETTKTDITISGGHIINPHDVSSRVNDAVTDWTNVDTTIVHGPIKHVEAKQPTCTEDGNIEYWQCIHSGCFKYFSDEECTTEIQLADTVIKKLGHSLIHVNRVESTCTVQGVAEHYICSHCACYFKDSLAQKQTTWEELKLPLKAHNYEEKWSTDLTHHWHECTVCHTPDPDTYHTHVWDDGKIIVDPASHKDGVRRYTCTVCQRTWDKAIPAHDHIYGPDNVVEPTCTEHGYTWHQCTVESCQQVTIIPDSYTEPYNHDLKEHHDRFEPTCTTAGNIDYWYCNRCKQYSDNEYFTKIITQEETVLKALGHYYEGWTYGTYTHYHLCLRPGCGEKLDQDWHNSDKICQDGASGHHWECSVCGCATSTYPHVWGSNNLCTVCGYAKPEAQSGGGGFDVQIVSKQPEGYLDYVYPENVVTVTYHDKNTSYKATKLVWYLNDEKQTETGYSFSFIPTGPYTHTVMCVFSNSYGTGSATKVISGKW